MPRKLFIAGPVQRASGLRLPKWIEYCYGCIEMAATEVGVDAERPRGELNLDEADPNTFRMTMRRRIIGSVAVIGMFLPGDSSVPAELSIAAEHNKPILVIHQPGTAVPRIMPGERIHEDRNEHRMTEAIGAFIRRAL